MSDLPIYYDEEEEWSHMLLLYDSAIKEVSTKLEILNNEFKLSHQYNPIEHISSRLKSADSIARKLRRREKELTVANVMRYVNDVAGVRVICSFSSDIYRIANSIANQTDVEILNIKDYIQNPKENGYMSYHMIITVPIFLLDKTVNTKVEIQIRTIAMDFWASLEHKIYYKFEGNAPRGIRVELKECADIVAFLDKKMLSLNDYVREFAEKDNADDILIDDSDVEILDSKPAEAKHDESVIPAGNPESKGIDHNNTVSTKTKTEKKKRRWRVGN